MPDTPVPTQTVTIETIATPDLGDRSYLVHDGATAAVIDPQRDIDRVLDLVAERGLHVTDVFETHIHNDYVTGGLALAEVTGATYHVAADDAVEFERHPIRHGDRVEVGTFTVEAVHTPGHTPHHLSFMVEQGGQHLAVMTGGSLLYGTVGRPDLISPSITVPQARDQWDSAHRLAELLPDAAQVFPTHGFGSFCSSIEIEGAPEVSTIGEQRRVNPALTEPDREAFAGLLVEGLGDYPTYYAYMGPANRRGPAAPDLTPLPPTDVEEAPADAWLVDLRPRREYAASHRPGTVNIEHGEHCATYVGWLVPWTAPILLLDGDGDPGSDTGGKRERVAATRRALARIGYDHVVGHAPATPGGGTGNGDGGHTSYRLAGFADLAEVWPDVTVLDVRRHDEWAQGHLPGAVHIPLHELVPRLDEVPVGEVWVHCRSGFRAAIAASLVERAGRQPILLDEDWERAHAAGLPVTTLTY